MDTQAVVSLQKHRLSEKSMLFFIIFCGLEVINLKTTEDMKDLQEWAEYYYSKGFYVWMPDDRPFNWNEWRSSYKQTLADVKTYNWKIGHQVCGVAGKKGIKVLSLKVENLNNTSKNILVKKVLGLLDLDNYPWVTFDSKTISIIVDCVDTGSKTLEDFTGFSVLYEGVFTLPTSYSTEKFYFNGIPIERPRQVRKVTFDNCIEVLKDYLNHLK